MEDGFGKACRYGCTGSWPMLSTPHSSHICGVTHVTRVRSAFVSVRTRPTASVTADQIESPKSWSVGSAAKKRSVDATSHAGWLDGKA